jgi:hypothetical protein
LAVCFARVEKTSNASQTANRNEIIAHTVGNNLI